MQDVLRHPVSEPSAWSAADFAHSDSWIYHFSGPDLAEIDEAVRALKSQDLGPLEFGKGDFPLPTLGKPMAEFLDELEHGRGFVMLRGLSPETYDLETLKILYWGLGAHLGQVISQNSQGDLLGYVTDYGDSYQGGDYYKSNVRGHRTRAQLYPHCDSSDLVGLLCVRPAKSGGRSTIVSSMTIYNEILTHHPEYLEPLCAGFHFDLVGKGTEANQVSRAKIPVFSFFGERLSCRFNKRQIELGAEKTGTPLTPLQSQAIDYVREVSLRDDLTLHMDFQPGDIQLLNNHCLLHSREGYTDHAEAERKRLLLRLWLNVPNGRKLAPEFADRLNTGGRGGVTTRPGATHG